MNRYFQVAMATVAAGAIFALCTAAVAQSRQPAASGGKIQSVRRCESVKGPGICGTFTDATGAVIPGVNIKLISGSDNTLSVQASDMRGDFAFEGLAEGSYNLIAHSPGFKDLEVKNIVIKDSLILRLALRLDAGVLLGVLVDVPMIDLRFSGITTIINPRQIESLPRRP